MAVPTYIYRQGMTSAVVQACFKRCTFTVYKKKSVMYVYTIFI